MFGGESPRFAETRTGRTAPPEPKITQRIVGIMYFSSFYLYTDIYNTYRHIHMHTDFSVLLGYDVCPISPTVQLPTRRRISPQYSTKPWHNGRGWRHPWNRWLGPGEWEWNADRMRMGIGNQTMAKESRNEKWRCIAKIMELGGGFQRAMFDYQSQLGKWLFEPLDVNQAGNGESPSTICDGFVQTGVYKKKSTLWQF